MMSESVSLLRTVKPVSTWRRARAVEWARFENECGLKKAIRGSNPLVSARPMKKIIGLIGFWFMFAVVPTATLLVVLIIFYSPLQGIGHEFFYARGTLLESQSNTKLMRFEESSTFWDTSDVAPIGSNLQLLNVNNPEMYQPGQKVIIKGTRMGFLGQIDNVTIYKNHFQPTGVDWSKGMIFIFIALSGLSLVFSKKLLK